MKKRVGTSKEVSSTFFRGINILKPQPTIVLFYSKNCAHCHTFMPIWDEFSETTSHVDTVKINLANAPQSFLSNITKLARGVPTVVYYEGGRPRKVYEGNRTLQSLRNFSGK